MYKVKILRARKYLKQIVTGQCFLISRAHGMAHDRITRKMKRAGSMRVMVVIKIIIMTCRSVIRCCAGGCAWITWIL